MISNVNIILIRYFEIQPKKKTLQCNLTLFELNAYLTYLIEDILDFYHHEALQFVLQSNIFNHSLESFRVKR